MATELEQTPEEDSIEEIVKYYADAAGYSLVFEAYLQDRKLPGLIALQSQSGFLMRPEIEMTELLAERGYIFAEVRVNEVTGLLMITYANNSVLDVLAEQRNSSPR